MVTPAADPELSGDSSCDSEDEDELPDVQKDNKDLLDRPPEFWHIQRLVKYLKWCNRTVTVDVLCLLMDCHLTQEACQISIVDTGGLEILLNLLDTDDLPCKYGSLRILRLISTNIAVRKAIRKTGGIPTIVNVLRSPNKDLKCLAAETIANVARSGSARNAVRHYAGIKRLVSLMEGVKEKRRANQLSESERLKQVEVARCGALGLWSCSKSTKNKKAMRKAGVIPLLAELLKSDHEDILIPVVGTLQECASEPTFRLAIRSMGMIEDLVRNLKKDNMELKMQCASCLFKCCEDREARDLVRIHDGLQPLLDLLQYPEDKEMLAAATGAIWKCSLSQKNVVFLQQSDTLATMVRMLETEPEDVRINLVGAIAACAAASGANRRVICENNGIQLLIAQLASTNRHLLVNSTQAIGVMASDKGSMMAIEEADGVRLLWSLLKNPHPEVQASAARAICPCIAHHRDAGEMVRSFVGGMELVVHLLGSATHEQVLSAVCALVAQIGTDEENLAIITDLRVVHRLALLTRNHNNIEMSDSFRACLASAIGTCCQCGDNREVFGRERVIPNLVTFLRSPNPDVHSPAAFALRQLSESPHNCVSMHNQGVVNVLMKLVASQDDELQKDCAVCISNIRRLAMCSEKYRQK